MSEIEELRKENEHLKELLKINQPLNLEDGIVIDLTIEDTEEDVRRAKLAKINNCEFVNAVLYSSLISKHFEELTNNLAVRMLANNMAESIDEAKAHGVASKKMLDSLEDWNKIVGNNKND